MFAWPCYRNFFPPKLCTYVDLEVSNALCITILKAPPQPSEAVEVDTPVIWTRDEGFGGFCGLLQLMKRETAKPGLAPTSLAGRLRPFPQQRVCVHLANLTCSLWTTSEKNLPYRKISPCGFHQWICRLRCSSQSLLWEAARRSGHFVWWLHWPSGSQEGPGLQKREKMPGAPASSAPLCLIPSQACVSLCPPLWSLGCSHADPSSSLDRSRKGACGSEKHQSVSWSSLQLFPLPSSGPRGLGGTSSDLTYVGNHDLIKSAWLLSSLLGLHHSHIYTSV